MKNSQSNKSDSNKNVNNQLYYPLFDVGLKRQKRTSIMSQNNDRKIIANTNKNKQINLINNKISQSKNIRNKSAKKLNY